MNNSQAVSEFEKSVREHFPEARIYTFTPGENARSDDWDYNVLVVLDDVNSITYEIIFDIACKIGTKFKTFLSPLLTKKNHRPIYLPHFF